MVGASRQENGFVGVAKKIVKFNWCEKKGCRGQMEADDWLRKQHKGRDRLVFSVHSGFFLSVGFVKPTHLEMFQLACQVGICWPAVGSAVTHSQLSLRPTSSPSAAASELPSSL